MLNKELFNERKNEFEKAKEQNEFFSFEKKSCEFSAFKLLCVLISIAFFFILINIEAEIASLLFLFFIFVSFISFPIVAVIDNLDRKQVEKFLKEVEEYNKSIFDFKCNELIVSFGKVSKIILCNKSNVKYECLAVYEDAKEIYYIDGEFNKFKNIVNFKTNKCSYDEILKYELIDETTSQIVASSSVTSSNVGKSIGGAIATGVLFGNPTLGAIVGVGAERKTTTKYTTKTNKGFVLNIFLNRLNDSIIKIRTKNREVITEIISTLEYLINK